ncbi:MAG: hypothetical protein NZM35_05685 [Chitinophagales bacterium]|nr:hypothetical protein [Chitinophagales bacterium]MDW8419082.1 hypothetical protein [Chitinophagales bacterium]
MLSLFKSNNPLVVLLYLPLLAALRILPFIKPTAFGTPGSPAEPLTQLLWNILSQNNTWLIAAGMLLHMVQAIWVNALVNEHKISARKNYLPGALYITLSAFLPENMLLSPASLGLLLIIPAINNVFGLIKKEKMNGALYDAGLLIGLAICFYTPYLVLIPFLYAALATLRPVVLREWIVVLLGLLTPFYIMFVIYYIAEWQAPVLYPRGVLSLIYFPPASRFGLAALVAATFVAAASLPGILFSSVIQVRKFVSILGLFCLFIAAGYPLQATAVSTHFAALALFTAVVWAMYFTQIKRLWIAEVMFIMLLLLVAALQWRAFTA